MFFIQNFQLISGDLCELKFSIKPYINSHMIDQHCLERNEFAKLAEKVIQRKTLGQCEFFQKNKTLQSSNF